MLTCGSSRDDAGGDETGGNELEGGLLGSVDSGESLTITIGECGSSQCSQRGSPSVLKADGGGRP